MDRNAFQKCSYGVYVVSTHHDGRLNGQIANTVCQVASDPPTVSVSINKENLTHGMIAGSGVFSISVLSEDAPMQFVGRFGFKSGRDIDKFDGIGYKQGKTKSPIALDYATSYMDCEVIGSMDAGTHTVFLGKVIEAEVVGQGHPMTYEYYHQIKGGKSPRTAPTYAGPAPVEGSEKMKTEAKMASYKCTVCGYIYDPAEGDPDGNIPAGTVFEDLPDSWVCPVCGAPKSEFEKVE